MTLPDPPDHRRPVERPHRPIVTATVVVCGACLLVAIVGLIALGWHHQGTNEVAVTALAAIGSTLAGGFAAWIGRTETGVRRQSDDERRTDGR